MNKGEMINMKQKIVFIVGILIYFFPGLLYSDNIIYKDGTTISNCEIIEEFFATVKVRLYTEDGIPIIEIPKRKIETIERVPRDETSYSVFSENLLQKKGVDGSTQDYNKSQPVNNQINYTQLFTGITLSGIGILFLIDVGDINDVIDNSNKPISMPEENESLKSLMNSLKDIAQPKTVKELEKERNMRLILGIISTTAGILNLYQSFENVEINTTANSVGVSYLF